MPTAEGWMVELLNNNENSVVLIDGHWWWLYWSLMVIDAHRSLLPLLLFHCHLRFELPSGLSGLASLRSCESNEAHQEHGHQRERLLRGCCPRIKTVSSTIWEHRNALLIKHDKVALKPAGKARAVWHIGSSFRHINLHHNIPSVRLQLQRFWWSY